MKIESKGSVSSGAGTTRAAGQKNPLLWAAVFLALALSLLFWKSYDPAYVHFSNDGPLGGMVAEHNRMPSIIKGVWADLNWLGKEELSPAPSVTTAMRLVTTPFMYARILPPATLFIAGICACFCFRKFKLTPLACILGGLVAGLNSDFLSTSCWGVASQIVGFGANYVALGLLAGNGSRRQWIRVVLAGMAVGIGIMEAYDIGAIFSLFVAAFVLYQALFLGEGSLPGKFGRGALRIALVAGFAAFISFHSLTSLIGTQLKGIVGTEQDPQVKEQRWAFATQWSLPKAEIFQVLIPGVFGYRNEWHMYESEQPKEDQYWGSVGAGGGLWRLSGTGFYAGALVVMVALWAMFQSFRQRGSPFSLPQRRALWFWSAALVIAALLAFGKHAPLYQFFYALPYASAIRNPAKFMHVFTWTLIIIFAYGIHGIHHAYLQNPVTRVRGLAAQFKNWQAKATPFERKWMAGCFGAIGVALLGWLIYASNRSGLEFYIGTVGIDSAVAPSVAKFSLQAVGWFVLFLAAAVGLLALIFSGQFAGPRAKWGGILLGALLVVDLGRADLPWIVYWDVGYKYASDPIINLLAEKPYEHRVSFLPIPPANQQHALLQNAYGSHWKQQLFPYYDIQCADVVQEPRLAVDKQVFMDALAPTNIFNVIRFWELSNTRYILAPGGDFVTRLDPSGRQFHLLTSFHFVPKRPNPSNWPVDYTAQPDPNGELGVLEFTGALPRAKLFSNWQVNTNDEATLRLLASPAFDTHQTILISDPDIPAPSAANVNQPAGTVEINPNYKSKHIELSADVKIPSVLFLCERYNPNWRVEVDGKPAKLLRCDFIMRGVYLEPGKHNLVFWFDPPITTLYVSLAAIALGLALCGWLALTKDDEEKPAPASPALATKVKAGEKASR